MIDQVYHGLEEWATDRSLPVLQCWRAAAAVAYINHDTTAWLLGNQLMRRLAVPSTSWMSKEYIYRVRGK